MGIEAGGVSALLLESSNWVTLIDAQRLHVEPLPIFDIIDIVCSLADL